MSGELVAADSTELDISAKETESFVTFFVNGQMLGIPVAEVQDILTPGEISPIPLSPPKIKGSINLRGRIVSVLDMRTCLNIAPAANDDESDESKSIGVTIEFNSEFYTLLVDRIGDSMDLPMKNRETTPGTLDAHWRDVSRGVYKLDGNLMIILDVNRLLEAS